MKKALTPICFLAALALVASSGQALGPYCADQCSPLNSCSLTCYTFSGFPTTCGEWGGAPCGVCVDATYHWGTNGSDSIYGGAGSDVIYGLGGDDSLYGGPGNDCLYGGGGTDYASGDSGHDVCIAETETSCED
jgi:hypothetical protein